MEFAGLHIDIEGARGLLFAYALQFVLFTLLALVGRGMGAIRWDSDLLKATRVNWAFIAMNAFLAPFILMLVHGAAAAFRAMGIPVVPESAWAGFHPIVPALAAVIVVDFVNYWSHRVRHTSALWPMHAVHHSDTQMTYLTWYRAHAVELIFIHASYAIIAVWMGAAPGMVAAVAVLRALHQQYVHMNVDWGHGPLKYVLASPRFHRWHHADHPEAWNRNFSEILPLWDKLFGTYYCPGPCRAPLGFPGNPGENALALTWLPFREWGRMLMVQRAEAASATGSAAEEAR